MNQLLTVKTLLLISFLHSGIIFCSADKILPDPEFKCGLHNFYGKFAKTGAGSFIITLRHGSSSPLEFILLGGNLSKKLDSLNSYVRIQVYVPQPVKDNSRPFVFIQKFLPARKNVKDFVFIKAEPCGQKSKFTSSE